MNSYLEAVLQEMESATAGLSDAELADMRPAEGKWSAAEILEHLRLTFTSTTKLMEKVEAQASPVRRATFQEWIGTFVVVRLGYMPGGRTAPEFARPIESRIHDIRNGFRRAIDDMDRALGRYEHAGQSRGKIAIHPILGPLSLQEWRKFHLAHTRHHMAQIRGMRQAPAASA